MGRIISQFQRYASCSISELTMIKYKKRRHYKYNLHSQLEYETGIKPLHEKLDGILKIDEEGLLTIEPGYAWDGPSGPTIDTKNFMESSLVHDAIYQLMREKVVAQDQRKKADQLLRKMCRDAGMSNIRAWWVYRGVRIGGASSAKPNMLTAP